VYEPWRFLRTYCSQLQKDHTVEKIVLPDKGHTERDTKTALHPLQDQTLNWEALKSLKDSTAQWLYRYYKLSSEKNNEKSQSRIYQSMIPLMAKLTEKTTVMAQLRENSPHLAKHVEQHKPTKLKVKTLDWQSSKYQDEWHALRTLKDKKVQWLVRFYDLAHQQQKVKDVSGIVASMTQLATDIGKNPTLLKKVYKVAPHLAHTFKGMAQNREREKDKGRDR